MLRPPTPGPLYASAPIQRGGGEQQHQCIDSTRQRAIADLDQPDTQHQQNHGAIRPHTVTQRIRCLHRQRFGEDGAQTQQRDHACDHDQQITDHVRQRDIFRQSPRVGRQQHKGRGVDATAHQRPPPGNKAIARRLEYVFDQPIVYRHEIVCHRRSSRMFTHTLKCSRMLTYA
jgi:hypothetical protein